MIIHVKLSFSLSFYATAIEKNLEGDKLNVSEEATIEEVLKTLGIPDHNDKLYFINDVPIVFKGFKMYPKSLSAQF